MRKKKEEKNSKSSWISVRSVWIRWWCIPFFNAQLDKTKIFPLNSVSTESQRGIDCVEINCKISSSPLVVNLIYIGYMLRKTNLFKVDIGRVGKIHRIQVCVHPHTAQYARAWTQGQGTWCLCCAMLISLHGSNLVRTKPFPYALWCRDMPQGSPKRQNWLRQGEFPHSCSHSALQAVRIKDHVFTQHYRSAACTPLTQQKLQWVQHILVVWWTFKNENKWKLHFGSMKTQKSQEEPLS